MSKVLKINNSYINDIISSQVPYKNLLNEDVIFAGGFPLSVYMVYALHREEYLSIVTRDILLKGANSLKYTDIDLWALHSLNTPNLQEIFSNPPISTKSFTVDGKESVSLTKKSKWANTIGGKSNTHKNVPIQFVKNPHNSPEELISTFDLNICKVAWSKGTLYVDSNAHNDFANSILTFGENYQDYKSEQPFVTALYRSLRYMKYAKRYTLDMSPEICEYIFNTYFESSKAENMKIYNEDINPQPQATIGGYVDNRSYQNSSRNMFRALINDTAYLNFAKQKNFKEEWTLFLLDHPLLTSVRAIVESGGAKALTKSGGQNLLDSFLSF